MDIKSICPICDQDYAPSVGIECTSCGQRVCEDCLVAVDDAEEPRDPQCSDCDWREKNRIYNSYFKKGHPPTMINED